MSDAMKIIYLGDGGWASRAFDLIQAHDYFQIEKVILRYDRSDEVLRKKAERASIEILCPENVNSVEFVEQIASCEAELGVSMSYNQIVKKNLICIFPEGIINCHAGKLPNYRGRNVLNWALINGEKEIGVTCHYIDEGIDTGDIIIQETFPVALDDDYGTVLNKAFNLCADVLMEGMEKIYKGKIERQPQPEAGNYFIERKNGDEFIDWNWESKRVYNFVRAITAPGPHARSWVEIEDDYRLIFIKKTKMIENAVTYNCIEGGVVGRSDDGNPLIKTGDTFIELTDYEIDHETKKTLKIGDRLGINHNLQMMKMHKE